MVVVSLEFWGHQFETGIYPMEQFTYNWYLPSCQCETACSHVSFIQNDIYLLVTGLNSPMESRSCPVSTSCCYCCMIELSRCLVVSKLASAVSGKVSEILGPLVRNLRLSHSAFRYFPRHHCTEICSNVSSIQYYTNTHTHIYIHIQPPAF